MSRAYRYCLLLYVLLAPLQADTVQFFTDRGAWTRAVRALDKRDPITTERFNDAITPGVTLQSLPNPDFYGPLGRQGSVENGVWSSSVEDYSISDQFDLLTFNNLIDAFGVDWRLPWDSGTGLIVKGTSWSFPLQGGKACGDPYFGLPLCGPHGTYVHGFFGVIDDDISSLSIHALYSIYPGKYGHYLPYIPYTFDNLSFQNDQSSATPEPSTWGMLLFPFVFYAYRRFGVKAKQS